MLCFQACGMLEGDYSVLAADCAGLSLWGRFQCLNCPTEGAIGESFAGFSPGAAGPVPRKSSPKNPSWKIRGRETKRAAANKVRPENIHGDRYIPLLLCFGPSVCSERGSTEVPPPSLPGPPRQLTLKIEARGTLICVRRFISVAGVRLG